MLALNLLITIITFKYATSMDNQIVERVRSAGYPLEVHTVITDDGYMLNVYRIKHDKRDGKSEPVFLMHGLQSSAYCYVICPDNLAFLLADNGYDVWLGNSRGNRYSSKHFAYNATDFKSKYWDFSFHEIAVHDLPTMIDFVLSLTDREKLFYVGHSQGTIDFFAMMSERPEMNARVQMMVALSPILSLKHLEHPGLRWAAANIMKIRAVINSLGVNGILISQKSVADFVNLICKNQTFVQICRFFLLQNDYNYETYLKNSQLPPEDAIKLMLEGVSGKQLYHLAQLINTGRFRQFNYGEAENLLRYGTREPPEYDVTRITAPTALFYAYSDIFTCTKDIVEDKRMLRNVVYERRIDIPDFNHLDFIIRKNVTEILYKDVLKLLNKYSSNT